MVIDLETATDLRPVSQVAHAVTGKRSPPSTNWRWIKRGGRGGKLEAVFLRGVWHTTPAAFADFIRRQTEAALAASPTADSVATDTALQAAGLL